MTQINLPISLNTEIIPNKSLKTQRKNRMPILYDEKTVKSPRISCLFQYSKLTYHIQMIIQKHWHIEEDILSCSLKLYIGLWHNKSLREHFVQVRLERPAKVTPIISGHFKCDHCMACKLTIECKECMDPNGLEMFKIKISLTVHLNIVHMRLFANVTFSVGQGCAVKTWIFRTCN